MDTSSQDALLPKYTYAEIEHYVRGAPRLVPMSSVFVLSDSLVAKYYNPTLIEDALQAISVARQLGIRVPEVKRTATNGENSFCISERIDAVTLDEAWKKLGWFASISKALQLRRWISLLRSVTSSTAGSLSTGKCRSFYLEDWFGLPARSRSEDIATFLRFWVNFTSIPKAMRDASEGRVDSRKPAPPVTLPFVLIHHDLAPRNILLDSDGQLWLVDWDLAGFYPPYFEYAAMQNFIPPQDWNFFARLRWKLFSWIAAGRYARESTVLERNRYKFTRFSVARRYELLSQGGPYRHPPS